MTIRYLQYILVIVCLAISLNTKPIFAIGSEPGANHKQPVSNAASQAIAPKGSEPGQKMGPAPKTGQKYVGPSVTESTQHTAEDTYNRGVYLFQVAQTQGGKGNTQGQKDLLTQAIQQFETALTLNPNLVTAQSNLGFAYLTLGKAKKAEKAFQKALALDSNHLNTLNGLATVQALRGHTPEALATFEKLTLLDPSNAEYWFNQGSVLQKASQPKQAEQAYQKALELNPAHQQSWFNLATLYENTHRFDDAVEAYGQAKHLDITTAIGLEATNRLQWLSQALDKPHEQLAP